MGRYGASELMRNTNLQKKAVNYGINKLTPFIQDSVGTAMDELSTKVRPPLEQQLSYNPETGEVTEWKVKPYNKVDEIETYHDICYDMGRNKGDCDREMVQSLGEIPYGEMPKWGSTARFLINTKQTFGLGLQKNASRC